MDEIKIKKIKTRSLYKIVGIWKYRSIPVKLKFLGYDLTFKKEKLPEIKKLLEKEGFKVRVIG